MVGFRLPAWLESHLKKRTPRYAQSKKCLCNTIYYLSNSSLGSYCLMHNELYLPVQNSNTKQKGWLLSALLEHSTQGVVADG